MPMDNHLPRNIGITARIPPAEASVIRPSACLRSGRRAEFSTPRQYAAAHRLKSISPRSEALAITAS
jgi:hypothetical protein